MATQSRAVSGASSSDATAMLLGGSGRNSDVFAGVYAQAAGKNQANISAANDISADSKLVNMKKPASEKEEKENGGPVKKRDQDQSDAQASVQSLMALLLPSLPATPKMFAKTGDESAAVTSGVGKEGTGKKAAPQSEAAQEGLAATQGIEGGIDGHGSRTSVSAADALAQLLAAGNPEAGSAVAPGALAGENKAVANLSESAQLLAPLAFPVGETEPGSATNATAGGQKGHAEKVTAASQKASGAAAEMPTAAASAGQSNGGGKENTDAGHSSESHSTDSAHEEKVFLETQTFHDPLALAGGATSSHAAVDVDKPVSSAASTGGDESVTPPTDPMAQIEAASAKPQMAFHSERLTEQMSGPELRFNWHSPEVGGIELSTSLRHHEVQMAVTTERADTASVMRAELPSLDSRLQEHSLRLGEVSIVAQERALSSGLGMENQQRGQREWRHGQAQTSEARVSDSGESVGPISMSDGRVSVLA